MTRPYSGQPLVQYMDLSDQPFRDWFDSGIDAEEAAEMALEDNGFDLQQEV